MTCSKTIAAECFFCKMPLLIIGNPRDMTPPVHMRKSKRGDVIYFHEPCFENYVLESVDHGKKTKR